MAEKTEKQHLTKERVLAGALQLADAVGMERFTIRRLAAALDVKPMTIYYHLPNKEAIIDGMVDQVFAEIDLPRTDAPWRIAVRERYVSARQVLNSHPWAPPLMESRRSPGPATLKHHDAVLGCFRRGLSVDLTAHAYAVLDSYLYGFAMEEAMLPGSGESNEMADMAAEMLDAYAGHYPNLFELVTRHVLQDGYDFGDSFEFGLDLILEAFEQRSQSV